VTAGQGPGPFPQVGFVAAGGAFRVRRNLDAIRSRGIELDAGWRTGPIGATLSWSRISARVEGSGAAVALDGLRPAQTPRDQLAATLDVRRGRALAAVTLRHVGRQFEDDANSRSLAPATTLDAFLAVPLTAALTLEARGENLGGRTGRSRHQRRQRGRARHPTHAVAGLALPPGRALSPGM
jgi:outer membrane receptor protein involved in Fe transport